MAASDAAKDKEAREAGARVLAECRANLGEFVSKGEAMAEFSETFRRLLSAVRARARGARCGGSIVRACAFACAGERAGAYCGCAAAPPAAPWARGRHVRHVRRCRVASRRTARRECV